jgi:hypothetical protein
MAVETIEQAKMAAWNSTGNVTVFTEYSTADIGNTDALVLICYN